MDPLDSLQNHVDVFGDSLGHAVILESFFEHVGVKENWGSEPLGIPQRSWDRSGAVLARLAVSVRFFGPLRPLLRPFGGAPGVVLVSPVLS